MNTRSVVLALIGCLTCAQICFGLAEERVGPDPSAHAQPGWPAGIVELLRHDSRVYSIWVNGNERIHFDASPEQLNALIQLFSKTRLRDHELRIVPGTPTVKTFGGESLRYNVDLHILDGIALFMSRRDAAPKTFEPTLTIHVDPDADHSWVKKISLPDNIVLKNEVESFPLMGRSELPRRETWHAFVQFEDDLPAGGLDGVSTVVTLWEKDIKEGCRLGEISREGYFHAAFSNEEIASLRDGTSWLTLTVGNYSTQPSGDHTKLAVDKLAREKSKAEPVKIARPGFYHGRLLFEDGTPAVLKPEPWPGAEIRIDFPYAGSTSIDTEGYFQVFFTEEQFEELKAKGARKNIYIPSYEDRGRSTALFSFPAAKLSLEKSEAGVVEIPKPSPGKKNSD